MSDAKISGETALLRLLQQHEPLVDACYDVPTSETGRFIVGHQCISAEEQSTARDRARGLLTYGEVLPAGMAKLLSPAYLDASSAEVLFDLGMGTGKAAILAFLSFPNLSKVLGIELAESRFRIARDALHRLAAAAAPAGRFRVVEEREKRDEVPIKGASPPSPPPVSSVTLVEDVTERALEIRCGDLFEGVAADELARCEVALLNTCFPASCYSRLGNLLACRLSHPRCRTVLYHDIRHLFAALPLPQAKAEPEPEPAPPSSSSSSASSSSTSNPSASTAATAGVACPFEQLARNASDADRFSTSWAPDVGFHFFCYRKKRPTGRGNSDDDSYNEDGTAEPPGDGAGVAGGGGGGSFFLPRAYVSHMASIQGHRDVITRSLAVAAEERAGTTTTTTGTATSSTSTTGGGSSSTWEEAEEEAEREHQQALRKRSSQHLAPLFFGE
jgi:hypothetical protein